MQKTPPKLLSSTFTPSLPFCLFLSLPTPPLLPPPVGGARRRPLPPRLPLELAAAADAAAPEACGRRPWSSRTPRSPPPPRVRDLRGTLPLARRSLCSTLAAAHAEGRSSRRVEEDERRNGSPREAPPPEPARRRAGGSRPLEQSRAARPPPRWPTRPARARPASPWPRRHRLAMAARPPPPGPSRPPPRPDPRRSE